MVSANEAEKSVRQNGEPRRLRDQHLVAGPFAADGGGNTIPANRGVEVAYAEIGSVTEYSGNSVDALSDIIGFLLGGETDEQLRTREGKAGALLRNSTPADLPDDVEIKIGLRKRNSSGMDRELTGWMDHGVLNEDSGNGVKPLPKRTPVGKERRVVTVHLRSPTSGTEYHHGNSTLNFPSVQGK